MKFPAWSSVVRWAQRLPAAAALTMVAVVYGCHLYFTVRYEYVNPFSNVEEWTYTNIAANNFLRFGFLNSLFLQDFSPSPAIEDHPVVYNHMPAGPDNATAVVLWLTGHDYRLTRFLFALAVLPGFYFYVRFVRLLFEPAKLRGAPLALLMVSPFVFLSHFEAQIHSPFMLLGFAPLAWLVEFARGGARWRLPAAVALLFALSIYVQYVLVAGVVFGLIFLWLLRVVEELKFKHVAWGVGAIATGVLLHLLQNLAYFGPDLFVKELMYTLGNRTVGVPTKEELKGFYESIHVVHHGSRPLEAGAFIRTLRANVSIGKWNVLLLAISAFAWWRTWRAQARWPAASLAPLTERFTFVLRLYIWAGLTIVFVLFLFPAFAQEMNLAPYGANHMFLGIPALALALSALELGSGLATAVRDTTVRRYVAMGVLAALVVLAVVWPGQPVWLLLFVLVFAFAVVWAEGVRGWRPPAAEHRTALAGRLTIFLLAVGVATAVGRTELHALKEMVKQTRAPNVVEQLAGLKKYSGELFMTNINLPTVAFFSEAPGFGVCELETVAADGTLHDKRCKVAYMRRLEYWQKQPPQYFFFFWHPHVFPGFSDCFPADFLPVQPGTEDCLPRLKRRLADHFPLIERNSLYEVYDLRAVRRPAR